MMLAKLRQGVFLEIRDDPETNPETPGVRYLADRLYVEREVFGGQMMTSLEHVFPFAEIIILPANVKVPGGSPT